MGQENLEKLAHPTLSTVQDSTKIEYININLLEAHRTENYRASGFRAFDSIGLRVGPGINEV